MDLEELKQLVELMNSNDLVEIEIESGDSKVRLMKAGAKTPSFSMPPMMAHAPMAMPAAAAGGAPMPAAKVADPVEGDSVTFNSPMVGTFYAAPSPTAETFVKPGDHVRAKTVLCIIEAMKVMNEITADMEGEILEMLVGNGEAVEYGQPLFTIKPK